MLKRAQAAMAVAAFMATLATVQIIKAAVTPDAPIVDPCTKRTTRIMYVNGINNPSPDDAYHSAYLLENALRFHANVQTHVETFWNPGDGFAIDLAESAVLTNYGRTFTEFVDAMQSDITEQQYGLSGGGAGTPTLTGGAESSIRPYIDELELQLRDAISNNQPVVLVAHSQGNLLVDTALREMRAAGVTGLELISVVGVATPDSSPPDTGGYFGYVKNSGDILSHIGLPSNFDLPGMNFPSVGLHSMDGSYLSTNVVSTDGRNLRDVVLGEIAHAKAAAEAAKCADPGAPAGEISAPVLP